MFGKQILLTSTKCKQEARAKVTLCMSFDDIVRRSWHRYGDKSATEKQLVYQQTLTILRIMDSSTSFNLITSLTGSALNLSTVVNSNLNSMIRWTFFHVLEQSHQSCSWHSGLRANFPTDLCADFPNGSGSTTLPFFWWIHSSLGGTPKMQLGWAFEVLLQALAQKKSKHSWWKADFWVRILAWVSGYPYTKSVLKSQES